MDCAREIQGRKSERKGIRENAVRNKVGPLHLGQEGAREKARGVAAKGNLDHSARIHLPFQDDGPTLGRSVLAKVQMETSSVCGLSQNSLTLVTAVSQKEGGWPVGSRLGIVMYLSFPPRIPESSRL